jgi:HrpA-like RNA helicase
MQYDHTKGMSCLVQKWTSQASTKQRQGRAGRVASGTCYKMYTRWTYEHDMEEHQVPEMLRVPLDSLVLSVLELQMGDPADVLAGCLDSPLPHAISTAIQNLAQLQAVSLSQQQDVAGVVTLTPLGLHLSRMGAEPRLAKLLVYGALFRCAGSIATIAAAMNSKTPFQSPPNARQAASEAKHKLLGQGQSGSDFEVLVHAFDIWQDLKGKTGNREVRSWCSANFVSHDALLWIQYLRSQFLGRLESCGLLQQTSSLFDHNANNANWPLIRCVLCAGLYPQLVHVLPPRPYKGTAPKKNYAPAKPRFIAAGDAKVRLHQGSVLASTRSFRHQWILYLEMIHLESVGVLIQECSPVSPIALLLFGGDITVDHCKRVLAIDNHCLFRSDAQIAVLFKSLRAELDKVLAQKIECPEGQHPSETAVIDVVLKLLKHEAEA